MTNVALDVDGTAIVIDVEIADFPVIEDEIRILLEHRLKDYLPFAR